MIAREEILTLIPHSGSMCLLERVLHWDAEEVLCETNSHCDPRNPLRRNNQLAALHLIEYGAQAAAIHGGLLARAKNGARPGVLASVRDLRVQVARLDDLCDALQILARKRIADGAGLIYEFEARCGGRLLAGGRVCVILQSGEPPAAET